MDKEMTQPCITTQLGDEDAETIMWRGYQIKDCPHLAITPRLVGMSAGTYKEGFEFTITHLPSGSALDMVITTDIVLLDNLANELAVMANWGLESPQDIREEFYRKHHTTLGVWITDRVRELQNAENI